MIVKLPHGGQLNSIAEHYKIPVNEWLDLSTGIAPYHYPIPLIPPSCWSGLPQASPELIQSASEYYGCSSLLAINGSQSVIQRLPILWQKQLDLLPERDTKPWVYLPATGYSEHEKAWRDAGSALNYYQSFPDLQPLQRYCVVVLINPNNPTGHIMCRDKVLALLGEVKRKKGLLIVDEAFMDAAESNESVIGYTQDTSLIVLRSIGKFFGLAGLRLGFAAASPQWLRLIAADQGPWPVSGPAQFVGQKALADFQWQKQQRECLRVLSQRLAQLLQRTFHAPSQGCRLFQTVNLVGASNIYQQLCRQAIYVRLTDDEKALRFGVPQSSDFARLEAALSQLN